MRALFYIALGALAATVLLVQKPTVHAKITEGSRKSMRKLRLVANRGKSLNRE